MRKSSFKIQFPDAHHLRAAIGWLELGNPADAKEEFEKVSPASRCHPDALEVLWQIHARKREWERCIEAARELTMVDRKVAFGWIHLSFALHELKRTQEAYDNLIGVLDAFPDEWLMRYNLACYACQLGNLDEADRWLAGAVLKGDRKRIKRMAKDDPDLAPLFEVKK